MSTATISTETWHGKLSGYTHHRCRCQDCRDARRTYDTACANGRHQLPELDWAVCARGGSPSQYKAHRRRGQQACPGCRRANADAKRARAAR